MYSIFFIRPDQVDAVWPDIKGLVDRIIPGTGGRVTLGSFYEDLIKNVQSLWLICGDSGIVGFFSSRVVEYPATKLLSCDMLAGDDMDGWLEQVSTALEKWAKINDCDGLETGGRNGWARRLKSLGWANSVTFVEKRW